MKPTGLDVLPPVKFVGDLAKHDRTDNTLLNYVIGDRWSRRGACVDFGINRSITINRPPSVHWLRVPQRIQ